MNYLAHAYLSFGDPEILTGNLIGDHVKGKLALEKYPKNISRGIMLHRKIDSFTDDHPATKRAKLLFRETYGLYAGAVMDSLYDHFLANDPKHFASEKVLFDFSQETYVKVAQQAAHFPLSFEQYFPYMREQNWLYHYRTLQGMQRSLNGLHRRAKHMPPVDIAYNIFIGHYYQLAQCYYELMDDIVPYVKVELSE
jgi:acyl carrier protein phosphodiesterase